MLLIVYKNGCTDTIAYNEYSDYTYDGKVFMVFDKNNKMMALINIDSISGIYLKNQDVCQFK
jgi:hypothetical protein